MVLTKVMLAQKGGSFLQFAYGSTVPESLGNVLDDLLVVYTNMAEEIVLVAHLCITFGTDAKLLPIAVKQNVFHQQLIFKNS
jgi:hypothetical protein